MTYVSALPHADEFLISDNQRLGWRSDSAYVLDVAEVEQALEQLEKQAIPSPQTVGKVVTLYRGELLPTCYDDWLLPLRRALHERVVNALDKAIIGLEAQQEYAAGLQAAEHLRRLDPLHEATYRHLMHLRALSGDRAGALRVYHECVSILEQELGVLPAAETQALYEHVLTLEPTRALGVAAPTLHAISSQSSGAIRQKRHNLPPQPTPLIGREAELAALDRLLADRQIRLITIVGAGGMGKTRLALACAENQLAAARQPETTLSRCEAEKDQFPNGVFFVSLGPLRSIDHIAPTLAEALGFQLEIGGQTRSPQQQILDYLRHKQMLIVMDNFEHLLDGVEIVTEILQTAPGVQILATSRERLHLHEEQIFAIQGLRLPDGETPADAVESPAGHFFMHSARRVQHDFELSAEDLSPLTRICRLVEGMPLGIELAASWVDTLSLAELASEIRQSLDLLATDVRNVPERHCSIRAVFDSSWYRLNEIERATFAQLSIFRGGFTRQAAQKIAHATLWVLGTLTSKSLLQYNKTRDRYQIHELLRQYSAEKLAADPEFEASVCARHSVYYCEVLQQRAADLKGPEQLAALAEIETDLENVRVAWDWAVEQSQVRQIGEARESLCRFYEWHGRYREGEDACDAAAQSLRLLDEPRMLAQVLIWQAFFRRMLGQREEAHRLLQQVLKLLAGLDAAGQDTQQERAAAVLALGQVARDGGHRHEPQQLYEQSLAIYRAIEDRWGMAKVLTELCYVVRNFGDIGTAQQRRRQLEQAEHLARQSVEICRALGDQGELANALTQLGGTLYYLGRFPRAISILQECAKLAAALDLHGIAVGANFFLGCVNAFWGRYDQARKPLQFALALAREIGYQRQVGVVLYTLGILTTAEGFYAQALPILLESLAIQRQIQNRHEQCICLAFLSYTEQALGDGVQAKQHLLEALRTATEIWSWPPLWLALPTASLVQLDRGEPEQAVELYALFLSLSFDDLAYRPLFESFAGRDIAAAIAMLPSDVAAAAQERGRNLNLRDTALALLAELEPEASYPGIA